MNGTRRPAQLAAGLALIWAAAGVGCGDGRDAEPPAVTAPEPPPSARSRLTRLNPPAAADAMAPRLAAAHDGVLLTWLESEHDGVTQWHSLRLARWDGEAWSAPRTLARGNRFFANWADLPAAIEAPDRTLLAHWLQMLGEGTYDYGVELTRSIDLGATWQPLGLLHDDRTSAEHGFVSFVAVDDDVQAFWLDGRAMPAGGAMQLRTTRLAAADGFRPGASKVLDYRVCECCATDAALTADGPVVAYRDRAAGEIRDIAIVRARRRGWRTPQVIADDGWEISGCPVNGPAIAARGRLVAVAWFTGAGGQGRVKVAFSRDAGATFGAPIEVDGDAPVGRVDVVLDDASDALVSWLGSAPEGGEIRLRRVAATGQRGPVEGLIATTTERSAGVPRMVRYDGGLVFTWVEGRDPRRVRFAILPDADAEGS